MKTGTKILIAVVVLLLAAAAYWYFFMRKTPAKMLKELSDYIDAGGDTAENKVRVKGVLAKMSPTELKDTYEYEMNYVKKGKPLPDGDLKKSIASITAKYNIFN